MPVFERTVNFFAMRGLEGLTAADWNKNMYILGGWNGVSYGNIMVMSPNGQDIFVDEYGTDVSAIPGRAYHRMVVHDNKLWVTGGYNGAAFDDCWYYNGRWTRTATAIGGARYGHAMYSYDGRMYIVGGTNGTTTLSDVWVSADGTHWDRVIASHPTLSRSYAGYCVYDNKMWLIGGYNGTAALRDCYCSVNGITWEAQELPADFPAVCGHTVTVFDNKMVLIGGGTGVTTRSITGVSAKLWYSHNGEEWFRGADDLEFTRGNHAAFAWTEKQRLIVTCGTDGSNRYADVWQTRGVEFLNIRNE